MKAVELSLNEWLQLYNELCEAERLLAEAAAGAGAGAGAETVASFRQEVDRLRSEVDAALHAVSEKLDAHKKKRFG